MEKMVCEMCSSNEFIKKDGFYVCEHCGTKYTLEEAKNLIQTVQIDRSPEMEKVWVLARRAKENGDSENAASYYQTILMNDPDNWEATFFQAYFRASQTNLINAVNAVNTVIAGVKSAMPLIGKLETSEEQKSAIAEVLEHSMSFAEMIATQAGQQVEAVRDPSNVAAYQAQMAISKPVVVAARHIFVTLEDSLKQDFSDSDKELIEVLKRDLAYLRKFSNAFDSNFYWEQRDILQKELQEKDSTYIPPQSGCYVATAVYGSYDCPQVWTLRRFRDYTLAETWYGRLFIQVYYAVSPTLVKWFGKAEWFKNMWKPTLDRMVAKLQNDGVESTPYVDKDW